MPLPAGADESAPVVAASPAADYTSYPANERGGELAVLEAFGDRALLLRAGLALARYTRTPTDCPGGSAVSHAAGRCWPRARTNCRSSTSTLWLAAAPDWRSAHPRRAVGCTTQEEAKTPATHRS